MEDNERRNEEIAVNDEKNNEDAVNVSEETLESILSGSKPLSRREKKKLLEKLEKQKLTKKQRVWKEIREWVTSLVTAVLAVLVLVNFIGLPVAVEGLSMYPTLDDGERLLASSYDVNIVNKVERGDVVICHYPNRTNKHPIVFFLTVKTNFVKRVVGLPGDTVKRVNGVTYINDVALDPSARSSRSFTYEKAEDGTITYFIDGKEAALRDIDTTRYYFDYEYVLGEDEYFMVGDNRYNSNDSRHWNGPDLYYHVENSTAGYVGPVSEDMIVGRVKYVFWPLSKARKVENDPGFMAARDR